MMRNPQMISLTDGQPVPGFSDSVRDAFSTKGILAKSKDFEYRPQQQELAVAVAEALLKSHPLVAEAGTGVGKSLAYLLPAARFALETGRKAVISTHTINLQEQLVRKDIPIVRKLVGHELPAVLLKGRQNYLCPLRLRRALEQTGDLFTGSENDELEAIRKWAEATRDGTLSDLDFQPQMKVWLQVCSEAHLCTARNCGPRGNCFFQEARKAAADANLVVVNHTLFFALLNTEVLEDEGENAKKPGGFLFPGDFAVLDEAHTIEQVAAVQLGLRVSQSGLRFDLQRLYHPKTRKGLLKSFRKASALLAVEEAILAADRFFHEVGDVAKFGNFSKECRVRQPELVRNTVATPLRNLWQEIDTLAADVEGETTRAELQDASRRLREAHGAVAAFLDQAEDDSVYWVERGGRDETQYSLHAAPVNVADRLRPLLFGQGKSVVLTSATLGVGDPKLGYFRGRVGAENARALCIGSPFDYQKQMRVRIYKSVPDPGTPKYDEMLAEGIRLSVLESQGRAFVLFTSYRTMRLARPDAGGGDAAPQDDRGVPQGHPQRALRHRQLLDRRGRAGRGALQCGRHPPALRRARPPSNSFTAGGHRGRRRQSLHGLLGAGGHPQAAPGRRPPDPHRARPRTGLHPRQPHSNQTLRQVLPQRPARRAGGSDRVVPPGIFARRHGCRTNKLAWWRSPYRRHFKRFDRRLTVVDF